MIFCIYIILCAIRRSRRFHKERIRDSRGIKELYAALNSERFIFIDRSTFINLDHVRRVEDGKIILRSGESLVISRRMLPQVKMEINRILGGW